MFIAIIRCLVLPWFSGDVGAPQAKKELGAGRAADSGSLRESRRWCVGSRPGVAAVTAETLRAAVCRRSAASAHQATEQPRL